VGRSCREWASDAGSEPLSSTNARERASLLERYRFVGRDILFGKTFYDPEGKVLRQEQDYGEIMRIDANTTWIQPFDSSDETWVPTDIEAIRPAPGGVYRLLSSGKVVTDPSLLTSWRFTVLEDESGEPYYEVDPNYAPMKHSRVPTEWDFTYRIAAEEVRRRVMDDFGDDYLGRSIILGITHTGPGRVFLSQEQIVGTILRLGNGGIVILCEPDGREFGLPPDLSVIEKAPPGQYRLRASGRVVHDPDYLATIELQRSSSGRSRRGPGMHL
jgi:hypothetical protein